MADYQPLVARAVAGLEKNTGENRRALYERARGALVNQLRGVQPALDESDITRERPALEEAIRKVAVEAVKRQRPDAAEPSSLTDQGLRGFRETVADAEGLGDASAEANRSAREFYQSMPGDQPLPGVGGEPAEQHYFEPQPVAEPLQSQESQQPPPPPDNYAPPLETPRDTPRSAPPPPLQRFEEDDAAYARPQRSYGGIVKFFLLLLVLAGIAGAGYWQRHTIVQMVANYRSAPASK